MLVSGNTGPATSADGAQQIPARMDRLNGLTVTELRARYAENTRRAIRFQGANQAAVTTTVGLATTYTGLVLYNPIGSPVYLELDKVGIAFIVAFAAGSAVGIMVGQSATAISGTTVDGQANALAGGASGNGLIYKAATLPVAPTVRKIFGAGLTGAITTGPSDIIVADLEGSIVLPPGGFAAIYTSTASGASGMLASMEWSEVSP